MARVEKPTSEGMAYLIDILIVPGLGVSKTRLNCAPWFPPTELRASLSEANGRADAHAAPGVG